jgi:protein SCO1
VNFALSLIAVVFISSLACERKQEIAKDYPPEVSALATEGGVGLPFYVGKDLRPVWQTQGAPEIRMLNKFDLKDQNGRKITSETLKGKIGIVSFFYSECPGICPMTTRNLQAVQNKFKNDDRFIIVSFSVTPEKDTPKKLSSYAKKNEIDYRRWRLLTGDREQIYRVARESFSADIFSPKENELKELKPEDFLHSENVYLIDGEQKLRGVYQGRMVSSLEDLARDAETLVK